MVTRKPAPDDLIPKPLSQAANNPPYPVSPSDEQPPQFLPPAPPTSNKAPLVNSETNSTPHISTLDAAKSLRPGDESESDHEWDSDFEEIEADDAHKKDLPAPLKVGGPPNVAPSTSGTIPTALRVGPSGGIPSKSQESLSVTTNPHIEPSHTGASSNASSQGPPLQNNNPYLRYQSTGQSSVYSGDVQSQPGSLNGASTNPFVTNGATGPVELPSHMTPAEEMSKLSFNSGANEINPWQDASDSPASRQPQLIPVESETALQEIQRKGSSPYDPGMDISSLDAFSSRNHRLATTAEGDEPQHRTWQEQQDWERRERERQQLDLQLAQERASKKQAEQNAEDEWHRGEAAFAANAQQSVQQQSLLDEPAPPLPPRSSVAPPKPLRPQVDTTSAARNSKAGPETPGTRSQRQRKEHYQIKHIRWFDAKKQGIRPAPILTQNANGPCPLLALVNALVLSTPAGEETALMETLRTREQVSLGLLLDAVFDELISGRRGDAAQQLPDVSDLYSFLLTLHTGMNVNPRFVRAADENQTSPGRSPHGGFEKSNEMSLYSTFNVPLIHGWLPPSESRAYAAFDRIAKTYDDAQNVQFNEEELEAKLHGPGLSPEEQNMFQDLQSIKDFLRTWPTQLTNHGLDIMRQNLKPGQIAILFRNDHFSTLYKEPRSGRIFTLVTDAGYSRHEEIVWETLVDVNGQGSELFSGDFRPVGNISSEGQASTRQERPIRSLLDVDDDQGWTTVGRNGRGQQGPADAAAPAQPTASQATQNSTNTEQEDHDLALALQLQEEEEDEHRREVEARRRRENELSEQFLSNDSNPAQNTGRPVRQEARPIIPPRRQPQQRTNRPAATGEEPPPPTYEQAAAGRPFVPPRNHPANPNAPAQPVTTNQSAFGQQSGRRASRPIVVAPSSIGGFGGRRTSGQLGQGHASTREDKEKCVIM